MHNKVITSFMTDLISGVEGWGWGWGRGLATDSIGPGWMRRCMSSDEMFMSWYSGYWSS